MRKNIFFDTLKNVKMFVKVFVAIIFGVGYNSFI